VKRTNETFTLPHQTHLMGTLHLSGHTISEAIMAELQILYSKILKSKGKGKVVPVLN